MKASQVKELRREALRRFRDSIGSLGFSAVFAQSCLRYRDIRRGNIPAGTLVNGQFIKFKASPGLAWRKGEVSHRNIRKALKSYIFETSKALEEHWRQNSAGRTMIIGEVSLEYGEFREQGTRFSRFLLCIPFAWSIGENELSIPLEELSVPRGHLDADGLCEGPVPVSDGEDPGEPSPNPGTDVGS